MNHAEDCSYTDGFRSVLDPHTLDSFFEKLERSADVMEIVAKSRPRSFEAEQLRDLSEARRRLLAGEVLGLQIRYAVEQQNWCDTLLPRPEGVALVRMRQPETVIC